MSKDPAFLFYSGDFLTGVADLTFEERGQYITLLALQHQKGHLTEKAIKITIPNVSEDVLAKFKIDKDGNYYNERLELEAWKRSEHSRKQKERAEKGWEKRKRQSYGKATANATALPLENENEDVIVDKEVNTHKLSSWIDKNAQRVNKMKEPLTFEQCTKLKEDFHSDFIIEILLAMHNHEPLLSKNRSANLTFRNWAKRDDRYKKWREAKGLIEIKMNT